ncbi:MAG: hypothetical protein C0524_06330 [Rhodobacter sp.]|nr:hypothetical protein [Rhodobacter sp.]
MVECHSDAHPEGRTARAAGHPLPDRLVAGRGPRKSLTSGMLGQLIRFGGVGGLATVIHVLSALAVQQAFPVPAQLANLAGFFAAVLVSYVGHARFTFGAGLRSGPQFLRFVLLSVLGLATSSATVWLITAWLGLGFITAMATVAAVVPLMTYLAMRLWVFDRNMPAPSFSWPDTAMSIGLATVLAGATLLLFWGRMLNHDTAWYLIATRAWLDGATLYVDIVEINPPLNFYLTVPALVLADLFGLSDTNGQYLLLSLMIWASLLWCSRIILAETGLSQKHCALLVAGVALAFVLPALGSMGQREQILVILAMPWVLRQALPGSGGRGQEIAGAAVAAIGVSLKPHFVLFPIAATLFHCLRLRSLRPVLSAANMTFLGVGSAYVAFVAMIHPTYLFEIVGIAREVYGVYRADGGELWSRISVAVVLLPLPVLLVLLNRARYPEAGLFLALSAAGLAVYVLQGTGFVYHTIPALAFGLVACVWIVLRAPHQGATVAAVSLVVFGLVAGPARRGFYSNALVAEVVQVTEGLPQPEGLIVLTSHVYAGPPVAIALGTEWSSRYPANWLVPGAINRLARTDCAIEAEICARLTAIAARNRADNIADILAKAPDLLIVDRHSGYFDQPAFDWEAFMAVDPLWSKIMANYQLEATTDRLRYFRRNAAAP